MNQPILSLKLPSNIISEFTNIEKFLDCAKTFYMIVKIVNFS